MSSDPATSTNEYQPAFSIYKNVTTHPKVIFPLVTDVERVNVVKRRADELRRGAEALVPRRPASAEELVQGDIDTACRELETGMLDDTFDVIRPVPRSGFGDVLYFRIKLQDLGLKHTYS